MIKQVIIPLEEYEAREKQTKQILKKQYEVIEKLRKSKGIIALDYRTGDVIDKINYNVPLIISGEEAVTKYLQRPYNRILQDHYRIEAILRFCFSIMSKKQKRMLENFKKK